MIVLKQTGKFGLLGILVLIMTVACSSSFNGKDLYDVLQSIQPDTPGRFEIEYVDGEVVSTCMVGGKYKAYYGWIKIADTFIAGRPVQDDDPATIYLFVTDLGDRWKMVKAGDMNKADVFNAMKLAGCEIPKH